MSVVVSTAAVVGHAQARRPSASTLGKLKAPILADLIEVYRFLSTKARIVGLFDSGDTIWWLR
jgi:hypothetical protein